MKGSSKRIHLGSTVFLTILALVFVAPMLIILMNSFKGKFLISTQPFSLPTAAAG